MMHRGAGLDHNPWGTPLFGASFFVLTGFCMVHVLAGMFYLAGTARGTLGGRATVEDVETAALYWNFVVIMAVIIFVTLVLPSVGGI